MVHRFPFHDKKEKSEHAKMVKTEADAQAKYGFVPRGRKITIGTVVVDNPLRKRNASESQPPKPSAPKPDTAKQKLNRPAPGSKRRSSFPVNVDNSNPFSDPQVTDASLIIIPTEDPMTEVIQIQNVSAAHKPLLNTSPVRMHSVKVYSEMPIEEGAVDPVSERSRSQSPFCGSVPPPTFSQMEALLLTRSESNMEANTASNGSESDELCQHDAQTAVEGNFPRGKGTVDYLKVEIPCISIGSF